VAGGTVATADDDAEAVEAGPAELSEEETADAKRLLAAAGGITVAGVATSGPAGVGFLLEPVTVPFWFPLAAFVLPTGETLALFRGLLRSYRPGK
jgi:hypothetical protein